MPDTRETSGWGMVRFGDVVRLCADRCADPVDAGLERFVGLDDLDPGDLRVRRWGQIEDGTTFTTRFKPGQVLFGKRRAYQRKVAVADFSGVCSGDIYVFEPKNDRLRPELLPFLCQTEAFLQFAVGTSAGSLSPRTNWTHLASYEFVLPPPEVQLQMIRTLRAANECVEAVETLAHGLVASRDALAEKYATAFGARTNEAGTIFPAALPRGWSLRTVRELCSGQNGGLTIGPFGSDLVLADYSHKTGYPVLFVADVVRYAFAYTSDRFVTEEKRQKLSKHLATAGDVLVTKMGWPPGEACIVPDDFGPAIITADVIRARVDPSMVFNHYLCMVLNSYWGQRQIVRIAPGTTRPKMTLRDFEKIRIAIPPLPEQRRAIAVMRTIDHGLKNAVARLQTARDLRRYLMSEMLEGHDVQ